MLTLRRPVRVLVIDRSLPTRRLLADALENDASIKVVGMIAGENALEQITLCRPDVVVLDMAGETPNGLDVLAEIMARMPLPIVALGRSDDSTLVMRALELGAIDFIIKPTGSLPPDPRRMKMLLDTVKLAAEVHLPEVLSVVLSIPRATVERTGPWLPPPLRPMADELTVVAIAASTGGPQALDVVLAGLPADLPAAVVIVQHMPAGFTLAFAGRLNRLSPLRVTEARDGDVLIPGCAYLAPGGYHLTLGRDADAHTLSIHLDQSPPIVGLRPCANVTFRSVAEACDSHIVGVVLTGMGADGADGLVEIRNRGGLTLAQDEATSVIYGMPRAALERGGAERAAPLAEIPAQIVALVQEEQSRPRRAPG